MKKKAIKITLTDIEKEKLLACIGIVAKDFEIKQYEVEKELNKIEKEGGRSEDPITLAETIGAPDWVSEELNK